jgi:aspartate/methionine/tyrosine aminotransferase
MSLANLTQYESIGINRPYNLADGHAHQRQNDSQMQIVQTLPTLFVSAETAVQKDLETEFQDLFFCVSGQESARFLPNVLPCYSASLTIDLIATYLGSRKIRTMLIEPCFDNLALLLKRRRVDVLPVSEDQLVSPGLEDSLRHNQIGALFLCTPNNPTGFSISEAGFRSIATLCARLGVILIIDFTFRFFARENRYDHYKVLQECAVSYLTIEDTGKTFPTLDLKVSLFSSSDDLFPDIYELHNDILLNVSPFILRLMIEYLKDAQAEGLQATIWGLIDRNRAALRHALRHSVLVPANSETHVSVEWLVISDMSLSGQAVVALLHNADIGLLPGAPFYWNNPDHGERYVRVALMRDPDLFGAACDRLADALQKNGMVIQ